MSPEQLSGPLVFVIPCLLFIAIFLVVMLATNEEGQKKPTTPTDNELLAREVRELRKRIVLEKGGAK